MSASIENSLKDMVRELTRIRHMLELIYNQAVTERLADFPDLETYIEQLEDDRR